MTPLLQLQTMKVFLQTDVKNLYVEFQDHTIKKQTLLDLKEMIDWLEQHIEVDSVLLTSVHKSFGEGWDQEELLSLTTSEVETSLNDLRQIVFSLIQLPQTIVADLKKGASGASIELALGADIRIMEENGRLVFNHLQNGMAPASSGIGMLSALMGRAQAKNWIQTSLPIPSQALMASGFIQELYNFQDGYTDTLLDAISHQSPVARVQAKRAFTEILFEDMKLTQKVETGYALASFLTGDFSRFMKTKCHKVFISAREWGKSIRPKDNTL